MPDKKYLAVGTVIVGIALLVLAGCGGDTVTSSTPTQQSHAEIAASVPAAQPAQPEAPAVVPEEEEDASGGRALSADFIENVMPFTASMFNTTQNPGTVSYCVYSLAGGYQNQGDPISQIQVRVPANTQQSDAIKQTIPLDGLKCGKYSTQIDLIRGDTCGQAPNNHGGYVFASRNANFEIDCECVEEPVISDVTYGPWVEGACGVTAEATQSCFEHRTVTTTTKRCGEFHETIVTCEQREVECPCIEEGPFTSDVGDPFGWGEVLPGTCEEAAGLSTSCKKPCHQLGTQKTETTYTCKGPEFGERQVCRDSKCPAPQCVLPLEDVYPKQGDPEAECDFFDKPGSDFYFVEKEESRPWDLEDGSFYLLKAGQYMRLQYEKPDRWDNFVNVDRWRTISHITVCACR